MSTDDRYFKLRAEPPAPDDDMCHCQQRTAIKLMCALTPNPMFGLLSQN